MSAQTTGLGSGEARVSLVFPPLVPTSQTSYYPSTAVLAGYLGSRGVRTHQANLNEVFCRELLDDSQLERIGNGAMPDGSTVALSSITAIAARVVRRERAASSSEGRDPGGASAHAGTRNRGSRDLLIADLLAGFVILDRVDELCAPDFARSPKANHLREVYARSRYVEDLGSSIHTVGISTAMGPQLGPALILAQQIKAARPDITVILGGAILSLMSPFDLELLLRRVPAVDAVVRFEGEIPLGMLVEQRDQGRWDPSSVPGVSVLQGERLHETPPVSGIRLEELAYPEYDPALLAKVPESPIGIIQARGCYWGRCTYCDYVELYDGSPRYRTRLPESFVDEMEYQISKHGRRKFSIITEAIPATFARKMSEAIIARGLDVTWNSFAMVDQHFTVDVLETLVRGGCDHLTIGLETLNTRVLQLVEKAADREQNIAFLRNAKRAGIKLEVNLIVDLPTTTYAEALENLQTLESVRDCFHKVRVWSFEATKSSAIGRDPDRFGLRVLDEGNPAATGNERRSNLLKCVDPGMTEAERRDAYQRYRAFATSIDSAPESAVGDAGDAAGATSPYYRFASEQLDFVETDAGLHCFNWITRKSYASESGIENWRDLFEQLRQKQRFQRSWFERQFESPALGKQMFEMLQAERFLSPCEKPSSLGARSGSGEARR